MDTVPFQFSRWCPLAAVIFPWLQNLQQFDFSLAPFSLLAIYATSDLVQMQQPSQRCKPIRFNWCILQKLKYLPHSGIRKFTASSTSVFAYTVSWKQESTYNDIFTMPNAKFTLEVLVSPACMHCHRGGGECQIKEQKLLCSIAKEGIDDITHAERLAYLHWSSLHISLYFVL